ncbi:FadR/GntR family transcriptional regulator [Desulfotomaculum sp. 1211_IL3151]|uniref:FadR/GntR family transcriptional regulator n=1 Tax=Desulfotomaculum sp. 1211_IL3151 TaxID=3084055 RepID=UPI002FDA09BD
MDFKPIKTKKIYEEIVEQVKQMIVHGDLSPGDKLLPERELAEKLQVGRSAVREAYRSLEAIGVIEIKPGEGTFVREMGSKSMTDIISLAVLTGKNSIAELLELRKIVEVEAAALAAQRRTEEDMQMIQLALDEMENDIKKGNLGDASDIRFHYAICAAAHNSLLIKLMSSISETMKKEMFTVREKLYKTPGTPARLFEEHKNIFEAIKKGDPHKARATMFINLDNAEKGFMKG